MDFDLSELLPTFLAETEEGLTAMEEALSTLEGAEDDSESLATIFRIAHTLKGSAGTFGFSGVTSLAHQLEELLERLREGSVPLTSDRVGLLLSAVDALRQLVPRAASGAVGLRPKEKLLLGRLALAAAPGVEGVAEPTTMELDLADLEPVGEAETRIPTVEVRRLDASSKEASSLRVDLEKLDRLLDLTGEICIARGQTTQLLEGGALSQGSILETHREADLLYLELQELVMKLRMVPVGPIFRKQIRTVRELASAHGKRVRLEIEGQDVEVDTSVIDHLRDPLTHLVRNAFDHGIEPPEERRRSGKESIGTIRLRARHDSGCIVVDVEDDGAGLDRARIRERALALGLERADELRDEELDPLIFEPGFSTARRITELSGRGVGMDVVKRNIEALRGSVGIFSQRGKGTTISIRLPLTLAIIEGFHVAIGGCVYIVPLEAVVETLAFEDTSGRKEGLLNLRGTSLPFVRLRSLLGIWGPVESRESIVVVRLEDRLYGIVVDRLLGQAQALIKPLPKILRGIEGLSGSTILGGGDVAFILDVPALLRRKIERDGTRAPESSLGAPCPG